MVRICVDGGELAFYKLGVAIWVLLIIVPLCKLLDVEHAVFGRVIILKYLVDCIIQRLFGICHGLVVPFEFLVLLIGFVYVHLFQLVIHGPYVLLNLFMHLLFQIAGIYYLVLGCDRFHVILNITIGV